MYKEFHRPPKAEISFMHILMTGIIVMFFFVIPAQFIYHFQTNPGSWDKFYANLTGKEYVTVPTTAVAAYQEPTLQPETVEGNVAGASTSVKTITLKQQIRDFVRNIDINDKDTQYTFMGAGFILISFAIVTYLIATEKKNRNYDYESKFDHFSF